MNKKIIIVILVSLVIFGCSQQKVVNKERVLLKQNLQEGTEQSYKYDITIQNTSIIKGNTQTSTTTLGFKITNKINRIKHDTLEVNAIFDEIAGSVKTSRGMQQIPDLDKLEGDSISVKILPGGKVEFMGEETEDDNRLLSIFKSTLSNLYLFLPGKEMKVGEKWEDESEEEGVSSKTIYILTGFENNKKWGEVCTIATKSEISQIKDMTKGGMEIHTESSGTSSSTIYCNTDNGLVAKIKSHAALEGTSEVSGNPMMGDMTIPTYVNVDTEVERIK